MGNASTKGIRFGQYQKNPCVAHLLYLSLFHMLLRKSGPLLCRVMEFFLMSSIKLLNHMKEVLKILYPGEDVNKILGDLKSILSN